MMKISEETKNNILQRIDIVDIVGEVVQLRRRGSNFLGLCPFHKEKTPSFTVSSDKGIYKCFGCGKSGNAISFMMEINGLSYPEAMKELARKAGVVIRDEEPDQDQTEKLTRKDMALKTLSKAALYYNSMLSTTLGKPALSYIHKRMFTRDLVKEYLLGYSPDSWDAASKELLNLGFTRESITDAGLYVEKENESYYDRFRGRLMFPIHDVNGKIVGFGARQLSEDKNQPKYINSPQSLVYDKSRILYGLYQGKNEIRGKGYAILVEGYADVLTLHQAGYKNAVASSGTSLTREQADLLYRYCKKVYICYDADSAGINAAERAIEIVLAAGFDVSIMSLPLGEDPDSLIRIHGDDIFKVYIDEAANFTDFMIRQATGRKMMESPAGKTETLRQILRLITAIPDRLQHDYYISRLASLTGLSDTQIKQLYREKSSLEQKQNAQEMKRRQRESASDDAGPSVPEEESPEFLSEDFTEEEAELLPEEKELIRLALNYNEAYKMMFTKYGIKAESFVTNKAQRFFDIITYSFKEKIKLINSIVDNPDVTEADKQEMSALALSEEQPSENWSKYNNVVLEPDVKKIIRDSYLSLQLTIHNKRNAELSAKLKDLTDKSAQLKILEEIRDIRIKISELSKLSADNS